MQTWLLIMISTLFSVITSLCDQQTESPHIYKIIAQECVNGIERSNLTGFRVTTPSGIVTALHGVVHCNQIIALPGDTITDAEPINLKLVQVDIDRDMALLAPTTTASAIAAGGLEPASDLSDNAVKDVCVIGYPLDIPTQLVSRLMLIRPNVSKKLSELIPPQYISALWQRNSPSLQVQVLNLEATLEHGHSGAPILNQQDQVIGVVNGGLAATTISWAIPWRDIEWHPVEAWKGVLEQLKGKDPTLVFSNIESPIHTSTPTLSPTATAMATPTPTVTPTPDLVAKHRPLLEAAVKTGNNAEAYAALTLDHSRLSLIFTGEALQERIAKVKSLKPTGNYIAARLLGADFKDFQVSIDERLAQVHVILTWEAKYYTVNQENSVCAAWLPPHKVVQTVYLERISENWMISAVQEDVGSPPTKGCP